VLDHVIVGLDFGVMLVTHVLDKGNDVACSVSGYLSILFCIGADLGHFVVKGQRVRVLLFCFRRRIRAFFWCCSVLCSLLAFRSS